MEFQRRVHRRLQAGAPPPGAGAMRHRSPSSWPVGFAGRIAIAITMAISVSVLISISIPTPLRAGVRDGVAAAPIPARFLTRATLSTEPGRASIAPIAPFAPIAALTPDAPFTLGAGIPVSKMSHPAAGDDDWADGFNWPGMSGEVRAFTVYQGALVAGGNFAYAGSRLCNGIARWNGAGWDAIGTGFDNAVEALVVQGDHLVAGGAFQLADGQSVEQVALWNGSAWQPLGADAAIQEDGARVRAFAVYGGNLIVGGRFTHRGRVQCNNIAMWDGTAWSPLGGGMTGFPAGDVTALAVYQNKLVAAGYFTQADGATAKYIAQWDGVHWAPLGFGLLASVQALQVFRDDLIVAGWFDAAGGYIAPKVARWNGTGWSALGDGFGAGNGIVYALAEYDSLLIAGGIGGGPPDAPHSCIGAWNGTSWHALGTGLERGGFQLRQVRALAPFGTDLIVGGDFSLAGGAIGVCIAAWTGQEWRTHTTGNGIDGGFVQSLADYQGALIAGGEYWGAGTRLARNIAAWDGSAWATVGTGTNGRVTAVASIETGTPGAPNAAVVSGVVAPSLFAGGFFTEAGGVPVTHVARWDGAAWNALGDGLDGPVYAFAPFAGGVVAGGFFSASGGNPVAYVASWDGSRWNALGSGMDDTVTSIAARDSELFAAGFFTSAGGTPARYVARWDGTAWSALGAGMPWPVYTLAFQNGKLVAGGETHGSPSSLVWEWDGAAWSPAGQLQYFIAQTSAVHQGELFVAGRFSPNPSDPSGIARRIHGTWQPLGSGIAADALVLSLCSSRGSLYASGVFDLAGNKAANGIARWDGAVIPVAIQDLQAVASASGVRVSWRLALDAADGAVIDVQRADAEAGLFETRGTLVARVRSEQTFDDAGVHAGQVYWYRLALRSPSGAVQFAGPVAAAAGGSGGSGGSAGPGGASWLTVTAPGGRAPVEIRFDVGRTAAATSTAGSGAGFATAAITVYSATGRAVRVLRPVSVSAGPQVMVWDGRDAHGHAVARGAYWVQLEAGPHKLSRKVTILAR